MGRSAKPRIITLRDARVSKELPPAPFLFFNGNTFADVARGLADLLFADLPHARRREVISAVAHFLAGVLDREAMVAIVDEVSRSASLAVATA